MSNFLRWGTLILGVLILACGVSLLFMPYEAYLMITVFIPISILFHGVCGIFGYIRDKETQETSVWMLIDGIFSSIIAVWLLSRLGAVELSLPFVFGFWVLMAGVLRIVGAILARKTDSRWGWLLAFGIIGVATGLFLLNHPLFTSSLITYFVIFSMIFMGFLNIAIFFMSGKSSGDDNDSFSDRGEPA